MSFVTATNIFQSYGPRPILERVNVSVEKGEFISIVGASGCGKSTFLRLLLAQETPTRGEIRIVRVHLREADLMPKGKCLSGPHGNHMGLHAYCVYSGTGIILTR